MSFAILKKALTIFTKLTQNASFVIFDGVKDVTMKTKIEYQINKNYIIKKNRNVLVAQSEVNQQHRKLQKQQMKDLNNKVKELTQAMETLSLKIE